MFQQWIDKLTVARADETIPDKHLFERLSALLLLEIARADTEIDATELEAIELAITKSCPTIEADEIQEIVATARQDVETSISLHEQIRLLNTEFSQQQKISLIEQMWRVAYVDGNLDKYEEYTIRQLADWLHVEHKEFIRTKLRVLEDNS